MSHHSVHSKPREGKLATEGWPWLSLKPFHSSLEYCTERVHISVVVELSCSRNFVIVSLETFQEQFSKLKEFEGRKDNFIDVSYFDDYSFSRGLY